MRNRRTTSDEERELFEATLADSVPLKKTPRRKRKSALNTGAAAVIASEKPRTTERAQRRAAGIDGNTADRLRRGLLEPQARLDLHGLTMRDAHRALVTFLRAAAARRFRLVLIVTGKGGDARAPRDQPFDLDLDKARRGVLRAMTPRWLKEAGLAELIAHVGEAHRRHGGAGALYVYLRKHA